MVPTQSSQEVQEQTILLALEPIRDLAKNWDIDIAGCLDEYLEELELSAETRELLVASGTLNFAQAAMVLHNSTGVYSRKVDYLHTWTYRVQKELLGEETRRSRNARQGTGVDEEVENFLNYDPDQNFLLLDDVIPVGDERINLKEDNSENDMDNRLSSSRRLSLHTSSRRLSLSSSHASNSQRSRQHVHVQEGLRLMHSSCHIGSDGALYIPGTKNSMEEENRNSFLAEQRQRELPINDAHIDDGDVDMDLGEGGGCDDDDHDDGPGFDMAAGPLTEVEEGGETKRVTFAAEPTTRAEETVCEPDPWEMLDPHETAGIHRPLRIGKTIQVPPHLVHLPSEGSFPAPPPPRRSLPTRRQPLEPVPLSGSLFGDEFTYIAKEIAKRAAIERRRNKQQQQLLANNNGETHLEPPPFEYNGDDLGLAYDDGDENDDVGDYDDVYQMDGPLESNTGTVDDVFHDSGDHDDHNSAGESKSFEELCRAHVRAFAKGAEKYASETNLSTRVREWQDRLLPHLQMEEQREAFDIHRYGETVLHAMKDNQPIHFSDVTKDCESYEVCRRFLATLSLCNAGNVRFREGLELELLSRNTESPMEHYKAPSAQQQ